MKLKPVIKWVGGKTQIIDELFKYFPKKINNYYEPFIGGGSVFLKLIEKLEEKEIELNGKLYLSDKNEKLINLYNTIKNNPNELLDKLNEIKLNYNKAKLIIHEKNTKFIVLNEKKNNDKKKYYIFEKEDVEEIINQGKVVLYYYYRNIYNKTNDKITLSALFIFLNKTCFRGVYRIGPNGFNVPYGNNKNVSIFDENYIKYLSKLFNKYNINFNCNSFEEIDIRLVKEFDFFYFDPPYYPLNDKSFVAYQKSGFDEEYNNKLINLCNNLHNKKVKFVHSNSDSEFINKKYKNFHIDKINCKRSINSKKPGSKEMEVIIYN